MTPPAFSYDQAFARNLGLVTRAEQEKLAALKVALPGLGGVGGAHLQTLARMGVGAFHLADPDAFEVVNFNRQLGATMQTIGRGKAEVAREAVLAINPTAQVTVFSEAVTAENIDRFLDGVDVVVDGIEFFHIADRRALYRAARARNLPIVNAGPIGYGAAVLVFDGAGYSFDEYFGLRDDMTWAEMILAFGLGLAPGLVSDVDPEYVDIAGHRGPALASACMLCAAAAATEVLKLVTGRGRTARAGHGMYIDPLRGKVVPLRGRPALRGSLLGPVLRWFGFRRFPAMREAHERELKARAAAAATATA